jgi:hypothetical protein
MHCLSRYKTPLQEIKDLMIDFANRWSSYRQPE